MSYPIRNYRNADQFKAKVKKQQRILSNKARLNNFYKDQTQQLKYQRTLGLPREMPTLPLSGTRRQQKLDKRSELIEALEGFALGPSEVSKFLASLTPEEFSTLYDFRQSFMQFIKGAKRLDETQFKSAFTVFEPAIEQRFGTSKAPATPPQTPRQPQPTLAGPTTPVGQPVGPTTPQPATPPTMTQLQQQGYTIAPSPVFQSPAKTTPPTYVNAFTQAQNALIDMANRIVDDSTDMKEIETYLDPIINTAALSKSDVRLITKRLRADIQSAPERWPLLLTEDFMRWSRNLPVIDILNAPADIIYQAIMATLGGQPRVSKDQIEGILGVQLSSTEFQRLLEKLVEIAVYLSVDPSIPLSPEEMVERAYGSINPGGSGLRRQLLLAQKRAGNTHPSIKRELRTLPC